MQVGRAVLAEVGRLTTRRRGFGALAISTVARRGDGAQRVSRVVRLTLGEIDGGEDLDALLPNGKTRLIEAVEKELASAKAELGETGPHQLVDQVSRSTFNTTTILPPKRASPAGGPSGGGAAQTLGSSSQWLARYGGDVLTNPVERYRGDLLERSLARHSGDALTDSFVRCKGGAPKKLFARHGGRVLANPFELSRSAWSRRRPSASARSRCYRSSRRRWRSSVSKRPTKRRSTSGARWCRHLSRGAV